ncbi:MAG TPA: PIG-L family deacetylase, partial [Bryobacterales bacterium]|nr:PIG-L family deacetylase [Bryobacterales bacterium]
MRLFFLCVLGVLCGEISPAENKTVLVVTAHAEDYLIGAGGTLAKLIGEGYTAHVVQVTNDEKNSEGLEPAETRKANVEEGDRAAKLLGVKEIVRLGHKSGELGYISSTELREEMFAMIRYFKPRIIIIPDPY